MSAVAIKNKDELMLEIKERINIISGSDAGRPVNLDNVSFHGSGRSNSSGKITITCLFTNDDGNVCADMYRTGNAGSVDFICGLGIDSIDERILEKIMTALCENRWSVADSPVFEKEKKRNLVSTFKIPFLQKGA